MHVLPAHPPRFRCRSFVRRIGYVPMFVWGYLGSAVPYQVSSPAANQLPCSHPRHPWGSPQGVGGSILPPYTVQVPMHLVVGKPIHVPHRADPSPEEVWQHLEQYIAALAGIFERHKAAAGHPDATLTII